MKRLKKKKKGSHETVLLAENVCIEGTAGTQFKLPYKGLKGITKLIFNHVSGGITCTQTYAETKFGCGKLKKKDGFSVTGGYGIVVTKNRVKKLFAPDF